MAEKNEKTKIVFGLIAIIGIMILYKDTKNVFTFNNIKTENERI